MARDTGAQCYSIYIILNKISHYRYTLEDLVVSGRVMAIYSKWYKCPCREPLVVQISICSNTFGRVEYMYSTSVVPNLQLGITGLQNHKITGSQDHRITGSQDHRITGSQDHRITRSQDHRITGSQDHRITGSQDHRITGSQDHTQESWEPLLYVA